MFLVYLLFLANAFILASSQELQCHEQGLCQGIVVGSNDADSYNICLDQCSENANCNWITFVADSKECVELYDCPFLDVTCFSCFSGQAECQPLQPVCDAPGFCNGHLVATNNTATVEECLKFCQSTAECNWYSYFPDNQNCLLTEDCLLFDDSCASCVAGERSCPTVFGQSKLFIVGGDGSSFNKVEVVDLSGKNVSCPSMPNYAAAQLGSVGVFIENHPLVCGGRDQSGAVSDCFFYDSTLNTWQQTESMLQVRRMAAAVQISPSKWWITGGNNVYRQPMMSTEIYTVGEGFTVYVDLPEPRWYHNLVKVNSTHFILLGDFDTTSEVWMFNMETETWSNLPNLLIATSEAQAGLITYPDGRKEVVVAAGDQTLATQIFSLDTLTWRRGPDFPAGSLYRGSSVPYGDTFLVVGGSSQKSIYTFNVESQEWDRLPETMNIARTVFAAFTVPQDFITPCS